MVRKLALAFILLTCPELARAADNVRMIVPFPASGSGDVLVRILGDDIARHDGPVFIVENRPGASTMIATDMVARAAPDGHTIGLVANSFLINAALKPLTFDPLTSFAPICHLVDSPLVLVSNSKSGLASFDDLKKKSGPALTLGALGPASTQHVAAELLKTNTGIDFTFVPYPGGAPAVNAIVGGQVDLSIANYSEVEAFIADGRLNPLAAFSTARIGTLKDVPTFRDLGFPFDISVWFALVTAAKVPTSTVATLQKDFAASLARPEVREKLAKLQFTPVSVCGSDFAGELQREQKMITEIVKRADMKAE